MLKFIFLLALVPGIGFTAVDKDHDGIADDRDQCPNTAQLKMVDPNFLYAITVEPRRLQKVPRAWPVLANGCEPDDDHDGVINSEDFCPEDDSLAISKGVEKNGCPLHTDSDGTPDYRDQCPGTSLGISTDQEGCPIKGLEKNKKEHIAARIKSLTT